MLISKCVVLTVTYNSARTITEMIDSLLADGDLVAELIIVDNGSTDGTVQVAEGHLQTVTLKSRVVRSENNGFAGGYETARQQIHDDYPILCMNPDVALAPGSLSRLLQAAELPQTAIATAPLRNRAGEEDSASRRKLPTLGSAALYAAFGRVLPKKLRYNSQVPSTRPDGPVLTDGTPTSAIEATTGALMMLAPRFRTAKQTLFDLDYWMYGEDLQLCLDASRAGLQVLMVETQPSLHIKGASSGLPRSRRSDRAFHDALFKYYEKNLQRDKFERIVVRTAIEFRYLYSRLRGRLSQTSK